MKRLAISILLSAAAGLSLADDAAVVVEFAKANADRYASELQGTTGLQVGSTVTLNVRVSPTEASTLIQYDGNAGTISFQSLRSRASLVSVSSACQTTGHYAGQNSFGAKADVRTQRCDAVRLKSLDPLGASFQGAVIQATPDQFRAIKRDGVVAVYRFTIAPSAAGLVVERSRSASSATIDLPVDTVGESLNVLGKFEQVSWQLPGSAEPVELWPAQKSKLR